MATPYVTFGGMVNLLPRQSEPQMSITYLLPQNVDPHGLSGSGAWTQTEKAEGIVWTPRISLVGLVTEYDSERQVLTGYRVEEIVQFLKTKEQWIRAKAK
jgi:hypothetical protein